MSTSRSTRVEMVPAEIEDFVSVEVSPEEEDDWYDFIRRDDFFDILPKLKPMAFRCRDNGHTAAIMGVGGVPVPSRNYALPWVWAVFDRHTIRERGKLWVARGMLEIRKPVQQWLNDNAFLFYTDPQVVKGEGSEVYTSTLACLGFRNLGYLLWQWPGR